MRSTFKVLFYLKKKSPKQNGYVPVMGRITINGGIAQFSAKISINPINWDVRAGRALGKSLESQETNRTLDKIRVQINTHYQEISEKDSYITATKVKNAYLGIGGKQETLLRLYARHNENFAKQVGKTRALGTYNKYCQVYNHLVKFIKMKYRRNDLSLRELNYQFVQDFDLYLRTEIGCNPTTVWVYMMPLKRMIAIARNNGWLNYNPFTGYKAIPEMATRGYLSNEDLGILMKEKFTKARHELVRDLFVFSCFTGLAYSDINNLTYDNLQISFDKHLWIMTKRQKTNVASNIRLLDIPKKIVEKYRANSQGNKIFHMPPNSTCNYILKRIAKQCNIKTYLTFHTGRHTFATTITLSQGVPIETVSKMLGHSSIKTTQIYAKITNQKISQDMEILSNKLRKVKSLME